MGEKSWKYYVVQKEIHPPMLVRGKKFVLRAHVLAWVRGGTLRLFLHRWWLCGSGVLWLCGCMRRASCVVRRASCVVRRASCVALPNHHAPRTTHPPPCTTCSEPLVSEHEKLFEAGGASMAALVLQGGTRTPAYLLNDDSELLPALRLSILEQMGTTAAAVFRELHSQHPLAPHQVRQRWTSRSYL
mmetsp:Transcript_67249/g.185340  ORF Transcript_67249/g.185340 Transcript_67249/m.185340 type:complete len:187 (+) Transcript_67249:688-1248(+)